MDQEDDFFGAQAWAPRLASALLREGPRFWIAAGAAGGRELPYRLEPYALRVAMPVALGKALGLSARESAELAASASSQIESVAGLRWLRWSVELPAGGLAALGVGEPGREETLARALGEALGAPMFARGELAELKGSGPGGDWCSASRDPSDLARLFAILERRALALSTPQAAAGSGKGPSRL